ncbi:MAG: protein kinase [Pirellulaceae bacterium]
MKRCPQCNNELDESDITVGNCSSCHTPLVCVPAATADDFPGATLPDASRSDHSESDATGNDVDGNETVAFATTNPQATVKFESPSKAEPDLGATQEFVEPQPEITPTQDLLHPTWDASIPQDAHDNVSLKSATPSVHGSGATTLHIQNRNLGQRNAPVQADYGILKVLGRGGMGVVYSAHQGSLARDVAVKMLLARGANDPKARDAFLSEAAVTGDLEHPNIVPIYDLGRSADGAYFYAMKQVQGTPWNKTIAEKSVDENIDYLLRVCDAVAFAHSKGIIHRDLKPENTMIGEFGEVLVMDWGLAIPTDPRRKIAGIELPQSMAGTPAYMAPEMAMGPYESISTRSDIYLLGAILFEIITGVRPHRGNDARDCMYAAARNRIEETKVTGELMDIAMKALATDPEDRFQTVQEFQQAIRDYQSHSESIALAMKAKEHLIIARNSRTYDDFNQAVYGFQQAIDLWPDNKTATEGLIESRYEYAQVASQRGDYDLGAGLLNVSIADHATLRDQIIAARDERELKQRRAKTYKRLGLALAALLFVIVSGAAVWINAEKQRADFERGQALIAKADADQKRIEAEAARDAEASAKRLAFAEKKKAEEARDAEAMARADEQLAKEDAIEKRRLAEIAQQNEKKAREAEAYEAYVARIAAASARIEENAYGRAIALLKECIPADDEADYRHWEWGRLWYLCQQASRTLGTQQPLEAVAIGDATDGEVDRIAAGGQGGIVTVWDAEGSEIRQIDVGAETIHSLAFSSDNNQLVAGTDNPEGFVRLINLESGQVSNFVAPEAVNDDHQQAVLSVRFSADSKRLLTGSRDGRIKLWDVATRRPMLTLHGHRSSVWQAIFIPVVDETRESKIVSVGQDGVAIVWHDPTTQWSDADTVRQSPPFREHNGPIFAVAVSGDGQALATAGLDGRVLIWNDGDLKPFDFESAIASGSVSQEMPYRELVGHAAAVRSVSFASRGRLLISAGHDNTIRVWNSENGECIKVLRGHGLWVRDSRLSADGRTVVSAGYDETTRIWDIDGYEEMRVLRGKLLDGHDDAILSADLSPDASLVVTGSRDRTIKTWDATTGQPLQAFREGHAFLASNAIAVREGRLIASAAVDDTVRLWDGETGAELRLLKGTGRTAALAASRDGRWILTGGPKESNAEGNEREETDAINQPDQTWSARLWNADTGKIVHELRGRHKAMVCCVAISPDAKQLFTGDFNGTGILWNAETGEFLRRLAFHQSKLLHARFTPDGQQLLTASLERGVLRWNLKTGEVLADRTLLHSEPIVAVASNRTARLLVTVAADQKVRIWDTQSDRVVRTIASRSDGGRMPIDGVAISPDDATVLTVSRERGTVRAFDVASGEEKLFPQSGEKSGAFIDLGAQSRIWTACFLADSRHVMTVGGDSLFVWEMNESLPQFRRKQLSCSPHGGVSTVGFSPDASEVVSGSWDSTANLWNTKTGQVRRKLVGKHSGPVHCATYSNRREQPLIATASADATIVLWDAESGTFVQRLVGHAGPVNRVQFSADDRRLVSASDDGTVRVWNLQTGEATVFKHSGPVLNAVFSPDGERIATATADHMALLWDVGTRSQIVELPGHTAAVTSIAISADGKRLLTGSEDFTSKLWDVSERGLLSGGKELLTLAAHTRELTSVGFSRDLRQVLTSSRDGTAIIWMAAPWTDINDVFE